MDGFYEANDGLSIQQTVEVEGFAFNEKEDINDIIVIVEDVISAAKRSSARNKGCGGRLRTTRAA